MAQLLGNIEVGSTVYLNENGSPQPYLVVHQGLPSSMYDASCNGTWLLRQKIYNNNGWGTQNNIFTNSIIRDMAVVPILQLFDQDIQNVVKEVKIPYCIGGGSSQVNSGANGYSCKVFLLSGYEVGWTTSIQYNFPIDGAKLSYFESGTGASANQKRSSTTNWWTRSPNIIDSASVWQVTQQGNYSTSRSSNFAGIRPAMVMPTDLIVDNSNNVTANQLVPPSSITAPSLAMADQSIPLSWTSVTVSGFDVTYQLQRNVNNGGWQNVGSPISQTSYTDTAQSGWTQVQYQVAAVVEGAIGDYTQSSIIPVSDPAVLVISGQDGNLGTLTSNLPYTVYSNTGNPISLTHTVNGAQVVTLTVESGFAYSIPVADLPTGTGTIQITASVEDTSQQIQTQTRTWTYYKTPINIPLTGGIAQLTQNGQNIWPVTVPDAVEAPVYLGGNLNAALNKLGQAALYTKIGSPKYSEVTVDLSKVSVGDEVLLPENGVMVPFYVGSLNYEPDYNTNRVLMVRKNVAQKIEWNNNGVNTYNGSTIDVWLNGTYLQTLDNSVQTEIGTTNIPATSPYNSGVIRLEKSVFILSAREYGKSFSSGNVEGTTLGISSLLNNSFTSSNPGWTRTPVNDNTYEAFAIINTNSYAFSASIGTFYNCQPTFTLPTTFNHTYYVDSSNKVYPSQEYTQGGSITDIFGYDVPICQYETGSYVGTGTYGEGSPNTLAFGFEPKIVFVTPNTQPAPSSYFSGSANWIHGTDKGISIFNFSNVNSRFVYLSWQANSVSWYSINSADAQLNTSGTTYNYVAIG